MVLIENLWNVTDYFEQAIHLPKGEKYHHKMNLLESTDDTILVRELSKIGLIISGVSTACSSFFRFNQNVPLTCTVVIGFIWIFAKLRAAHLEPQAKKMIEEFMKLRNLPPRVDTPKDESQEVHDFRVREFYMSVHAPLQSENSDDLDLT